VVKRDMKPAKAVRGPRTCCVCGAQCGTDGPWPQGWDSHMATSTGGELELRMTCGQACRQTLGLPERQMGLFQRGEP
jgi:hypothetical protein